MELVLSQVGVIGTELLVVREQTMGCADSAAHAVRMNGRADRARRGPRTQQGWPLKRQGLYRLISNSTCS